MQSRQQETRRRFRTPWGELESLCARIHKLLYVKKSKTAAKRCAGRLQRILKELPENDLAIIREEGLALLHELKGELRDAIRHREREIELMEKLHRHVETRSYDEKLKASILVNRDSSVLQERRAILNALKQEVCCLSQKS